MSQSEATVGEKSPPSRKREPMFPHLKFADSGDWRANAKCVGMTEVFFPKQGMSIDSRRQNVKIAQSVCAECTVRKECFNFAKKNDEVDGVWGGVDFYKPRNGGKSARKIPDSID
jgi:WhiB family redox-sensing transcriptional regulator